MGPMTPEGKRSRSVGSASTRSGSSSRSSTGSPTAVRAASAPMGSARSVRSSARSLRPGSAAGLCERPAMHLKPRIYGRQILGPYMPFPTRGNAERFEVPGYFGYRTGDKEPHIYEAPTGWPKPLKYCSREELNDPWIQYRGGPDRPMADLERLSAVKRGELTVGQYRNHLPGLTARSDGTRLRESW